MTKQELQQHWKERIAAYRASGLSQVAFCREQDISLRQLSYWLRKEAKKETVTATSTRWLPVEINNQGAASENNSLQIKMGPASIEIRPGFDQKLLLDVLKTLKVLC